MNLDDIKKIQESRAKKAEKERNAKKQEPKDINELIANAQSRDAAKERTRKTPTKEEKLKAELDELIAFYEGKSLEDVQLDRPIEKEEKVHDNTKLWDVTKDEEILYFDPTLSYELTGYRPITLTEGLDFDPKAFTTAADAYRKNGRYTQLLPGTFRHKLFWDEEWDRCINGMTVGKYRITGQNYFWLNYYRLSSVISNDKSAPRVEDFPGFLNKQYEYFHYMELVRALKKDGLAFKARRVGASEIAASNIAHAYTFYKRSTSIVTAFLESYTQNTLDKVWAQLHFLNTQTDGYFRHVRMKIDTDMHKRASKVDKDRNESGWMSEIIGITHDKPRKLRGYATENLFFEEAGSDIMLEKTYILSEPLVAPGGIRIGSRWVFGTAGDETPALAALRKMFYDPASFDILPYKNCLTNQPTPQLTGYFIPSYSMWFGDSKSKGYDERGVVDEERAKKFYTEKFLKITDSHLLLLTKAEFCFTPEDAFILEGSNTFDQERLNDQYQALTLHKTIEGPKSIRLSWGLNEKGDTDRDSKPKVEFVSESPLKISELPLTDSYGNAYLNLYVAGIDAIDVDTSTSTGLTDVSQFCIIVYRRLFGLLPPKIVAIYKDRPRHIQTAFDTALKLCQFYNCKALVEATRISIKTHFERYNKLHYLMRRPQATTNTVKRVNTRQYGVPATEAVIEHYLDLIEQYIVDYCEEIQFPDLLDELIRYSYENKRKFDAVAAFGMALLADEDMLGKRTRTQEDVKKLTLSYIKNEYGQIEFKYDQDENGVRRKGIVPY